jgi:DNA-binding transcriptional LysR family regulator
VELRQLRYFVAVAEELNFGRAATRLHMTQPPLTRQIRALEERIGAELFVRTPQGVELTAAGRTLHEEATHLLLLAQRAEARTRETAQGLTGRLEVGLFSSSVLDLIPRILGSFHRQRPDVAVGLHTMSKPQQIEALRERRIAVGFNRLVPDVEGITVETVAQEDIVVGLHESHPLCARSSIRLQDLEGEPMILYPNLPIPGLAQEVANAFRQEKLQLQIAQDVEDVLTCVALVSAGFGSCITVASAATLGLPHVVYRPLQSRALRSVDLCCLYRNDDRSPVLHAFLDTVRAVTRS